MPWKTCQCEQWVERRLYAEAERRVAAEEIGIRGIGQRRIQGAGERQRRLFEVAEHLRVHRECDHRWQRRDGRGQCGECGHYLKYYLMVRALTGCHFRGILNICSRDVINAGTATAVVVLSTDSSGQGLKFLD